MPGRYTLDLSGNRLTQLPPLLFDQNPLLSVLRLDSNAVSSLPTQPSQLFSSFGTGLALLASGGLSMGANLVDCSLQSCPPGEDNCRQYEFQCWCSDGTGRYEDASQGAVQMSHCAEACSSGSVPHSVGVLLFGSRNAHTVPVLSDQSLS